MITYTPELRGDEPVRVRVWRVGDWEIRRTHTQYYSCWRVSNSDWSRNGDFVKFRHAVGFAVQQAEV